MTGNRPWSTTEGLFFPFTKFWMVSCLLPVLLGCAEAPMQTYKGARLPREQAAVLRGVSGFGVGDAELMAVDGQEIDTEEAEVLPGQHVVSVKNAKCTCEGGFVAAAGRKYGVSASCSDGTLTIGDVDANQPAVRSTVPARCR